MIMHFLVCIIAIPSGVAWMRIFRLLCPSRPVVSRKIKPDWVNFSIPVIHAILVWSLWEGAHHWNTYTSFCGLLIGLRLSATGLTGSIASGKSTASVYLRDKLGYIVVDADQVARKVLDKDTSGYHAVIKKFGRSILNQANGQIDRLALGAIVFADPVSRRALERITHPRIVIRMFGELLWYRLTGHRVVLDVPLLFESPNPLLRFLCNERVLIDLDYLVQKNRIMARNPDMPQRQIEDRIRAQMSREKKLELADYVITNNGTLESFYAQLDAYFR